MFFVATKLSISSFDPFDKISFIVSKLDTLLTSLTSNSADFATATIYPLLATLAG